MLMQYIIEPLDGNTPTILMCPLGTPRTKLRNFEEAYYFSIFRITKIFSQNVQYINYNSQICVVMNLIAC